MSTMNAGQVAATILNQLGSARFSMMTGAKGFVGGQDSLSFKIGRGAKKGINAVRIVLKPSDTYAVSFMSIRGINVRTVETVEGVYAEDLRRIFTEATGFYVSL